MAQSAQPGKGINYPRKYTIDSFVLFFQRLDSSNGVKLKSGVVGISLGFSLRLSQLVSTSPNFGSD